MINQISSETLCEKAYEAIRNLILRNEFLPGEVLSIESLAQDLGVSPTPVREALAKLSADGLIEHMRNKRVRVARITEDDVRQTYEVRRLLEPYAASLAAKRVAIDPALEDDLHEIQQVAEKIQETAVNTSIKRSQYETYLGIDLRLQEITLEALGNTLLKKVLTLVSNHSLRIRSFAEASSNLSIGRIVRIVNGEHLAVIKALLDSNPERVQEAVQQHLNNAEDRTVQAIKRLPK